MSKLKPILGTMRLPFLVMPVVCVLLGISTAVWTQGEVNVFYAVLAFVGALASHISVNVFNEYFDFRSGLDAKTQKTPFSGGSGTLQARPEMARAVLLTAVIAWSITALIGLYFLYIRGWGLLLVGIPGLVIVYTYTTWILRNPWLSLMAPGLGFGTLWVMGTNFVLTGEYSWTAFMASLVPFFLVNDLLLLNQFPDVEADRAIGRRHFPIVIGREASSYIYTAFLTMTYLSIILGVVLQLLPVASLLGLITIPIAVRASMGAIRNAEDLPRLVPFMGLNVIINLSTPLLMAIGIFIAAR